MNNAYPCPLMMEDLPPCLKGLPQGNAFEQINLAVSRIVSQKLREYWPGDPRLKHISDELDIEIRDEIAAIMERNADIL